MDTRPLPTVVTPADMHAITAGIESQEDVTELKSRIARLAMICEALWEIVKEKNALPPDLINLKVAELDMSDGKLNGRKANTITSCRQCGRVLQPGRQSCLYCGAFSDQASVFNGFA